MEIIPVIDLKNGVVVAAQKGKRDNYQPIQSLLCQSSTIESVVEGFLSINAFKIIYIADLDAITKSGNNQQLIKGVIKKYSQVDFWVDSGVKILEKSPCLMENHKLVFGSEYQMEKGIKEGRERMKGHTLSLDFFPNQGYVGPVELLANASLWPNDVIIMSLEYVGSGLGPDIERLGGYCQQYPDKNFIAAGGVRGKDDLLQLKKIGVKQVLIATALHAGKLTAEMIKSLQVKKCPE